MLSLKDFNYLISDSPFQGISAKSIKLYKAKQKAIANELTREPFNAKDDFFMKIEIDIWNLILLQFLGPVFFQKGKCSIYDVSDTFVSHNEIELNDDISLSIS